MTDDEGARPPHYARILREDAHPDVRPAYMHLGHWDEPALRPLAHGVYKAQANLAELVVNSARLHDGDTVLDAGCGFGGILQIANEEFSSIHLIGADLASTQLEICARLIPKGVNQYSWLYCDATRLPIVDKTIDVVISVESAMHFHSRYSFFAEVRRVLRTSGALVMVDLLLERNAAEAAGFDLSEIKSILEVDFETLPELGAGLDEIIEAAATHGLQAETVQDITANTLPTYAPEAYDEFPLGMMRLGARPSIELFVQLHSLGLLRIYLLRFTLPQGSQG